MVGRFLTSTFVVTLSTLLVVQAVPTPRAGAQSTGGGAESSGGGEGFSFSEHSQHLAHAQAETTSSNAMKTRKAPVSAMGAYTDSVAVEVPPGRSGMTPRLALTYSSGASRAESAVGTGWQLGVPSITRHTEGGFPQVVRTGQGAVYDVAGRYAGPHGLLVRDDFKEPGWPSVSSALGFVPQREQEAVRYEFVASQDRWVVHLPSGVKQFYGTAGIRNGRVVNELGTHEWLLLEEVDIDGNTIEYDYYGLGETTYGQVREDKRRPQSVPVLKVVRWGGNKKAGIAHLFEIRTTTRSYDGPINMLAGHVMLDRLIERMEVYSGAQLAWSYDLSITPSVDTGRPLLRSVTSQAAGTTPRVFRFEYSTNGGGLSFDPPESLAIGEKLYINWNSRTPPGTPQEFISPTQSRAGYRFEDFDADGAVDAVYHPAGLTAGAARFFGDFSWFGPNLRTRMGGWRSGFDPNMLIHELSDLDGDRDLDAVSWPMTVKLGTRSFTTYHDYDLDLPKPPDCPRHLNCDAPLPVGAPPRPRCKPGDIECISDELGLSGAEIAAIMASRDPIAATTPQALHLLGRLARDATGAVWFDVSENVRRAGNTPLANDLASPRIQKFARADVLPMLLTDSYFQFALAAARTSTRAGWDLGAADFLGRSLDAAVGAVATPSPAPSTARFRPIMDPSFRDKILVTLADLLVTGGLPLEPDTDAISAERDELQTCLRKAACDTYCSNPQWLAACEASLDDPALALRYTPPFQGNCPVSRLHGDTPLHVFDPAFDAQSRADGMGLLDGLSLPDGVGGPDGLGLPDGPLEPRPPRQFQIPQCTRMYMYCQSNSCPNSAAPVKPVGALKVLVARQGYRNGREELWRDLPAWPSGVNLNIGFENGLNTRLRKVIAVGGRNFYAPVTDVNGDGRADILLLKHVAYLPHPTRPNVTYPVTQYVPRVYLNSGSDLDFVPDWDAQALGKAAIDIDDEPDSTASDVGFTKSLLDVLSNGHARSCTEPFAEDCPAGTDVYTPTVSFNTLVLDINQDGLPDLVAAAHPRKSSPGAVQRQCVPGHQVYLNRGYRFTTSTERASKLVPREQWSAPTWTALALGEDIPLARMRNTAVPCPAKLALDQRYADVPQAEAAWTDINADGRVDLIFAGFHRTPLIGGYTETVKAIYLNGPRGFVRADRRYEDGFPAGTYLADTALGSGQVLKGDLSRMVDLDNDGLVDILDAGTCAEGIRTIADCSFPTVRHNAGVVPDLLTRATSPSGGFAEIDYLAATSPQAAASAVVTKKGTPPIGLQVVSEVRSGMGRTGGLWPAQASENVEKVTLRYENFVHEESASSALGFERVSATFSNSEDCTWSSATTYRCSYVPTYESVVSYDVRAQVAGSPVRYPLKGYARRTEMRDLGSGGAEQITTHSFVLNEIAIGAVRIRDQSRVTASLAGGLWLYTASENTSRDAYGYVLTLTSGRANERGEVLQGYERTVTKLRYAHRIPEWHLGLVEREVVEGEPVDAATGEHAWRALSRAVTAYRPDGHVATHWVLQDSGSECSDGAEQWSRTDFETYNLAGLVERLVDNGTAVEVRYDAATLYPERRWTDVPASDSSGGAHLEEWSTYDLRWGVATSTLNMNGHSTSRRYDSRGRRVSETGPDGLVLSANRYQDPEGGPFAVETDTYTTPTSFFTNRTMLDGAGGVIASNKQVAGTTAIRVVRNQYDGFGRLIASYQSATADSQPYYQLASTAIESGARATHTAYDGFDRVARTTLPDGRAVSHAYDNVDLNGVVHARTTTTNPRNLRTDHVFDARGAPVALQRFDAQGQVELAYDFSYDGLARLVAVRDSQGVRRVGFDEGGRTRYATLAHRPGQAPRMHAYCYDERDKLVSATTPAGRMVTIARDALGRAARVDTDTVGGSTQPTSTTFYYDCAAAEGSLGKQCGTVDDASRTHIAYDLYGRPYRYEYTLDEAIAETLPADLWNRYITEFRYGLGGQLDSFTVEGLGSAQRTVRYTHDSVARTTGISVSEGSGTRALVTGASYDAFERLKSANLGNGTTIEWVFDLPSGHLTSQRAKLGSGVFAEQRYPLADYDPNGNITREQRYHLGELVSEKNHTYDALDQLATSQVRMDGVERKDERFTVHQGNLTSVIGAGGSFSYGYTDPQNTQAVTEIVGPAGTRSIAYDDDGWVQHDVAIGAEVHERSLSFDASGCMRESRVTSSMSGARDATTVTRNLCGSGGTRTYRETTRPDASVERVYYLPDGSELRPDDDLFVMQLPVATATVATLAWSLTDGSIVHDESGYIHSDVRGSVVARTSLDAADVRVPDREAEYEAWGQTLAYDGVALPRYQFTNEEPEPGTGYYYFGARPYDPTLRRWLAPDPEVMGNLERDASAGEQLNLYAYAGNNPVVRTDSGGRFFDVVVDAVSLAAGMAAIAAWGEKTSTLDKALDVGGLVADVAAAAIPFVPGGASLIRQVATKADDLVDASKTLGKVDHATDAAAAANKGADAAKGAGNAADAGKAGEAAKRAGGASKAGEMRDGAARGAGEARFAVTESGVAIPTNAAELKSNLSQLGEASTNPATSRKFVGSDSQGPLRVRVEQSHSPDPNFQGTPDPLHTVDHLHIDRRANGQTGSWGSPLCQRA